MFKKGAMFGLDCRALKKQFGKLFLASRQSDAPQGANSSCGYAKRGAMFGLDARIALAIFGALSVISGAALYSAIQESKVTATISQMREFGKAYEQLVLDIGGEARMSTDSPSFARDTDMLLSNTASLAGWNGPYVAITDTVTGQDDRINTTDGKKIFIVCAPDDDFGGLHTAHGRKICASGEQNYNWVLYESFPLSIAQAIDLKIDGELSETKGNVRLIDWGGDSRSIYLKLMPTLDFK